MQYKKGEDPVEPAKRQTGGSGSRSRDTKKVKEDKEEEAKLPPKVAPPRPQSSKNATASKPEGK